MLTDNLLSGYIRIILFSIRIYPDIREHP